ncbi:TPA: cupin domain-containing protein [Pseudomonas aeruginosa]
MHGLKLPWLASPQAGVDRRPLYRVGAEQARATSLVRYLSGSHFNPHLHTGGEEILVLEGVFEDEHGLYPTGTYLRNPPGSQHAPGSTDGCVIFVRLRQFHPDDHQQSVSSLTKSGRQELFESEHEHVWVEDVTPRTQLNLQNSRGLELLVLQGELMGAGFHLEPWSWMRLPAGTPLEAISTAAGARLWIKDAALDLGS